MTTNYHRIINHFAEREKGCADENLLGMAKYCAAMFEARKMAVANGCPLTDRELLLD